MTQPLRGTDAGPATGLARDPLSREQTQFCVQFSTALSRARAYPPTHPLLVGALDQLVRFLDALIAGKAGVVVGVTRDRLLVNGAESDPSHPVLRELATRLHHHQLAAFTVRPGVERPELADFLAALASDAWKQGKPLGLEPQGEQESRWPGIEVEPLPLDQLELDDPSRPAGPAALRATRLWEGLVHAATSSGGAGADPGPASGEPAAIAARIRARRGEDDFSRSMMNWMVQYGEQVEEGGVPASVQERVAELFANLDQETLDSLLHVGATREQRRAFLRRGAQALPVQAVLDLVRAAAGSAGEEASPTLLRMLAKLAGHLDPGAGPTVPDAEAVIRDSVRQLVGSWEVDSDQSTPRQMLELLARPINAGEGLPGRATATPLRLVHIGLELGADSAAIAAASRQVVETLPLPEFLELLQVADAAGLDTSRLRTLSRDPAYILSRLMDETVEFEVLDRLLAPLGTAAAIPLLQALEESESASRRRALIQRLEALGPTVAPMLVERLPDKPWFVQRNLLALLAVLPDRPEGFSAAEYARHENARVRREALKLQFRDPAERTAAILAGAADVDPGIVLLALGAASEQPHPELVARLPGLLTSSYREAEVRTAAIRLLGSRPTPAGRDWLLGRVQAQKGWLWFKRQVLLPRSPEMLVSLAVLARSFRTQSGVAAVLQRAIASGDPEIRAAARAEEP